VLATQFTKVDFSTVDPVYPDKTSPAGAKYQYSKDAILARGQACLASLYDRKEKVIAVVSHSGFLREGVTGNYFANADYRVYDFEPRESPSEPYHVKQWDSMKNGGLGQSWDIMVELGEGLPDFPPMVI
jgi:hypothetical protein